MHFSVSPATAQKISATVKSLRTSSLSIKHMAGNSYEYTVVLSKRQGSAVKRNRIKRFIREIMRRNCGRFPNGSYLIYVNHKCDCLDKKLIASDLEKIIASIKHTQNKETAT